MQVGDKVSGMQTKRTKKGFSFTTKTGILEIHEPTKSYLRCRGKLISVDTDSLRPVGSRSALGEIFANPG